MQELLVFIARSLVDDPDAVSVTETRSNDDRSMLLELRVAKDDMGKVIGRQGKIARSIRAIMKAAAVKENVHVSVDIIQ